jgi:hypothetical protein
MINAPKTIEEARKYRYGNWAGLPNGHKYIEGYCAYEVSDSGRPALFRQCYRKNGKGLNDLYCGIHAKKVKGGKYDNTIR